MKPISYTTMNSPLGEILLANSPQGLTAISFQEGSEPLVPEEGWVENDALLRPAVRQLEEYFRGERELFELSLDPAGTPFQRRVWSELQKIPYGETISYGELARRVGNPQAQRAVGAANGRNPLAIVVPCHRVIGTNGKLTGYAGGLRFKEFLLDLESSGRVTSSLFASATRKHE